MNRLISIIVIAVCGAGLSVTASAQNPMNRNGHVVRGGDPLAGKGLLDVPAKGQGGVQHRLGERNPLKPPFVEIFDDYQYGSEFDQFERYFQVINSDGDTNPSGSDRTWGYYNYNGESAGRQFSKCAYLQYPLNVDKCDDWLIPRAIKLEAGKYYLVSLDASLFSEGMVHTFEVKMGEYNDAEGMTYNVIPVTDVTSIRPKHMSGWFLPEFDGLYYMGIHGVSDYELSKGGYLFIDNIAVDAPRTGREPGQVSDVTFVLDPDGTPSATISFKAPMTGVDGKAITGSMTIVVERDGTVIKTFDAAPGQSISFVDEVAKPNIYTYSFEATNSIGSGCTLYVDHFVGMGAPVVPAITSISEPANGSVHLAWTVPATDVNGTAINPEKLRYNIYRVMDEGYEIVKLGYDKNDITIDMGLDPGSQDVVMFAVAAEINGEESVYSYSDNIFIGDPYYVPYHNHFTGKGYEAVISGEAEVGMLWRMLDDFSDPVSQDGDNSYICLVGNQTEQYGELSTGKIDLTDVAAPYISFYTYVYDEDENEVSVIVVDCATGERTLVNTYPLIGFDNIGWTRIACPLKDFAGKVVRVVIGAKIISHGYVPFDNLTIDELSSVDMSVERVQHTRYATTGETYEVVASLTNLGADRIENFVVNLLSEDKVIDSVNGGPLDSFGSTDVKLHGQFSPVSPEMPRFQVEVVAAGDSDDSNNLSDPFNITFLAPCHPVVDNLQGTESGNAVTLSWNAPDLKSAAPEESLEDFESYEAFSTKLNGFTMFDADGGNVAGFSGLTMPVSGTPQAYWTMTNDVPYNFLYTSGRSSLFAMATVNEGRRPIRNDDWLISPELYGGRQTIGFRACSQRIDYGYETFEVYASTTTNDISSFEKVMEETAVGEDWTSFYVTLAAGTKYFAIRCTSNDCMLFTLDDITYIGVGSPRNITLKGYNVYRNGVKLNSEPVATTTYLTSRELDGDDYFVTAVYDVGESTASNVVHLGASGINESVITSAASETEYFNMHGIKVSPSHITPGIYIERRGSVVSKVLIR